MHTKEQELTNEDLSPLADILIKRFIQRDDMFPKQLDDGSYVTIHKPLDAGLILDHLRGDITLGTYLLDPNNQGRFLVLDADCAPDWRRLQALAAVLNEMEATSYLEKSRRGGHLWFFPPEPTSGKEIREFGHGILAYFGIENIELFPKQDNLTTGPGSLVRIPFGVHRKNGRRYGFYLPNGEPLANNLREQIKEFTDAETLPEPIYRQFKSHWLELEQNAASEVPGLYQRVDLAVGESELVSERIKALPIRQFILNYVELSPSGRGLCPFHDDHNPSFAINEEGNYWQCFVPDCVGGGSAIDFYMRYQERIIKRDCDFTTAVRELAEMLI